MLSFTDGKASVASDTTVTTAIITKQQQWNNNILRQISTLTLSTCSIPEDRRTAHEHRQGNLISSCYLLTWNHFHLKVISHDSAGSKVSGILYKDHTVLAEQNCGYHVQCLCCSCCNHQPGAETHSQCTHCSTKELIVFHCTITANGLTITANGLTNESRADALTERHTQHMTQGSKLRNKVVPSRPTCIVLVAAI